MRSRDVRNFDMLLNMSDHVLIYCSWGQGTQKKNFSIQLIRETVAPATPIFWPFLKAAFQSLFGKTTSPVETLFSTLKSSWKSLDLSNLSCPPTTACYRSSVDSILEFLDDRLLSDNLQHLTRGDYKELLELSKVCLGGTIERKKTYSYQLSRPGAEHHARWVSQCLYILKLSLLQHQIDTISPQTKKKINTMASFILFVYIKF